MDFSSNCPDDLSTHEGAGRQGTGGIGLKFKQDRPHRDVDLAVFRKLLTAVVVPGIVGLARVRIRRPAGAILVP